MDEMKNGKDHACKDCDASCGHCGHGCGCCHGHYGKHAILRWVLGIIILVAVFCAGLKLGFFAASIGACNGYGGYGSYGMQRMMKWNGSGYMMNPYYFQQTAPASSPAPAQ